MEKPVQRGPKRGTGVPPVDHGQDGRGTEDHGQDAHATESSMLQIRRGAYLPHWTKEGATYSVTFRLADSLSKEILENWLFERKNIVETAKQIGRPLSEVEEKRLLRLHSEKVERYLDAGHGACWMKQDRIAGIVAGAITYFDGQRYGLAAWCVMPNHAHVVLKPNHGYALPDIQHSWKSFSAKQANKALARRGKFWQEESYDHLIRDEADFDHCVAYTLVNPELAGLKGWRWSGKGVP